MGDGSTGPVHLERIGPYRILDVLGEGGMGIVYAAEQTEPVVRRVALKLVRAGTGVDEIGARFEAERQALAVMEHPGIAKVLDAGTTPAGSPYFVMEYVDGVPITEYCDAHELGIRARLDLFLQVCDAVQHAHRKGIIHRDLKPSNILVTEQAGAPLAKIIDFGIAKAVGVKLTEKTLATSFGAIMGTPAYMSPEQADGSDLDVDTRADVYALGVILYELCAGAVPLDPDQLGFLPFLSRLIASDTPKPRPSVRVATGGEEATTAAGRRGYTPDRLRRRLAGDLDWIAMKAIETDRERRYGSASELAADVGRHLHEEPILARPPGRAYRARKFVRRHRAAVAGGAAALVLLVAGTTASTLGFVRASRAEEAAIAQGDRARRETATATGVSDFLVGLFRSANPGAAGRNDVTALEILDAGVASIDEELADQPVVRARLLSAMGDTYAGLGLWQRTAELEKRALALREEALEPDDPEIARSLAKLADLLPSTDYPDREAGRRDPAILEMAERALAIRRARSDEDTTAWLSSVGQVAMLYGEQGRVDEGEEMYRTTIAELGEAVGTDDPRLIDLEHRFAIWSNNNGHPERMSEILEDLIVRIEGAERVDSSALSDVLNDLAWSYDAQDRGVETLPVKERVLAIDRATLGDRPAIDLEPTLWNLAMAYSKAGRHVESAERWLEIVDNQAAVYGPDHLQTATSVPLLAIEYVDAGEPRRALPWLERAIPIMRDAVEGGETGDFVSWRLSDGFAAYGIALLDTGSPRPEEAVREIAGADPDTRYLATSTLGGALDSRGEHEAARRARALAIEDAVASTDGDATARANRIRDAHIRYAVSLLQLGRADELRELEGPWLAATERLRPGDNDQTIQVHRDMASLLFRGEPTELLPPIESVRLASRPHLERALAMRERMGGPEIQLVPHLVPLRSALLLAGRTDEAAAIQERVRRLITARLAELEEMQARGEIVEAARWNGNCWWAALVELPELGMSACDAAVEGATGDEIRTHHDSRGIARAVLGDYAGAIEDLEIYLADTNPEYFAAIQRQRWVDRMKAGEAPFTKDELGALGF